MHRVVRWVRSGSTGALGAAWFVQVRLVRLGAHLGSLGSFGFVWFVRVCPCDRWVYFRLFGTSECALGFIRFVGVRLRGRWIRSGSSGLFASTVGIAGFVGVPLARPREHWVSLGSFRYVCFLWVRPGCLRVRLDAPLRLLGSFGFVLFVRGAPWVRWVGSGSSGSSECALGVTGFVRVRLDRSCPPWWCLGSFSFV